MEYFSVFIFVVLLSLKSRIDFKRCSLSLNCHRSVLAKKRLTWIERVNSIFFTSILDLVTSGRGIQQTSCTETCNLFVLVVFFSFFRKCYKPVLLRHSVTVLPT